MTEAQGVEAIQLLKLILMVVCLDVGCRSGWTIFSLYAGRAKEGLL